LPRPPVSRLRSWCSARNRPAQKTLQPRNELGIGERSAGSFGTAQSCESRSSPGLGRAGVAARVRDMMERVGLEPAWINRYPHEFSGGQNQRVGIARAMIVRPKLVICDEAVSGLDASIQAQIIELVLALQAEFGMAMIFISHDLSVVRQVAHKVMVLYLGRVVEFADAGALYEDPRHPYTRALIAAVPKPDPRAERARTHVMLTGDHRSIRAAR
jgi:ABC-type oligopeptide transport system ATPase subunit